MASYMGVVPATDTTFDHSRRHLLQGSAAMAALILLSGREVRGQGTKAPRIGFLAVGSREGRAWLIEGFLQGRVDWRQP